MSRGDKRERDRAKTQAKLAKQNKGGAKVCIKTCPLRQFSSPSLSFSTTYIRLSPSSLQEGRPEDRNAADKAKLEAKIAAKKEMKEKEAQEQENSTRGPVARKKKETKKDSLDDLLDAGLTKGKKKK
jgi:hypothetical protein